MKVGDIITIIIDGFGLESEEDGNIIEEITDEYITLEGLDSKFYKNNKGKYRTKGSPFGMIMEIKEEE